MILTRLLSRAGKGTVFEGLTEAKLRYADHPEGIHFARLFDDDFAELDCDDIRSSGYVVDTLEAAVWCLLTTDSYAECVLKAVNLGEDTDTSAAVA